MARKIGSAKPKSVNFTGTGASAAMVIWGASAMAAGVESATSGVAGLVDVFRSDKCIPIKLALYCRFFRRICLLWGTNSRRAAYILRSFVGFDAVQALYELSEAI